MTLNHVFKVRSFFDTEYLTNGYRYGHSYYRRQIGNCTQAFKWHQFQWPWMEGRYEKNDDFWPISCSIWETVIVTWAHSARQFVSIEFSFHPYNSERDCPRARGIPRGNKNVVKIAIFGFTHWLKHRITRKLLKIDGYMQRGVWQVLNCLFIHATFCVIATGATPWQTKNEGRDT